MPQWPTLFAVSFVTIASQLSSTALAESPSTSQEVRYFETEVQPILKAHCLACHNSDKRRSGLNLAARAGLLQGGERGPAVLLDRANDSLLLHAVQQDGELKMPPKGKLAPAQIEILARWIKLGLPWCPVNVAEKSPPRIDEKARTFWSFRSVVRPALPAVEQAEWVRTPVDAFVLAGLESAGLRPAPPAHRTSLLRRLTYDLTGLPPRPEVVAEFLADSSADAYERMVDRLLASPHYGERWGRHWLDLVRYAETNGYEFDQVKPNVWRYRDYVIKSFNGDKPYDQFIREQLAGDEMEPATADRLIATGFYHLAPYDGGAPDRLQARYDGLDDIVATTGQVFLGLTVNCARCHDHKIDPFSQADYYRLLAFFQNLRTGGRSAQRSIPVEVDQDVQKAAVARYQRQVADLTESIRAFEAEVLPHLTPAERDDFKVPEYRVDIARKHVPEQVSAQDFQYYQDRVRLLAGLRRRPPAVLAQALCVSENGRTPPDTFVLLRGNPRSPGDKVEPEFPSVLVTPRPTFPDRGPSATTSGRRTALADWIAGRANPLTARVMVNRIWQHHFGRGIVRSSSDFGYGGTPPTHPELLDWLANEFVERGWSVKAIHKLIVMSNTYRMSSNAERGTRSAELSGVPRSVDPENERFSHFELRRLSAEEVRDSVLAVCGNLNAGKMGGPSVFPRLSREVLAGQSRPGSGWGRSTPEEEARRSIYIHIKRSLLVPILAAFDGADPDATCPVRFTTTVPTQALAMLNGEFLNEQSRIFAADLCRQAGENPAAQVSLALRRVTQREPTPPEVDRGTAFLRKLQDEHQLTPDEALRAYCLFALNLNEFLYLD